MNYWKVNYILSLQRKKISNKDEKREILNIFKEMWQNNNSALHRMYASWEELESHVELKEEKTDKSEFTIQRCPYCEAKQQIRSFVRGLFPYHNCDSCNQTFFIDKDYALRRLSSEEKENMPKSWIHIIDGLEKKKLSIVFKIE
jgi:hypothetical protein